VGFVGDGLDGIWGWVFNSAVYVLLTLTEWDELELVDVDSWDFDASLASGW
jgi:hypothetical protein